MGVVRILRENEERQLDGKRFFQRFVKMLTIARILRNDQKEP
jgi:hypothetical protein